MRGKAAQYFNPFRLAAYVLLLYCVGHTAGALLTVPTFGGEADAVREAMSAVTFRCENTECTWMDFYLGFGWLVSVFFLLSAGIAWYLGGRGLEQQRELAPLAWMLAAGHAAGALLAWTFFFLTPGVFASVTTVLLTVQGVRLSSVRTIAVQLSPESRGA